MNVLSVTPSVDGAASLFVTTQPDSLAIISWPRSVACGRNCPPERINWEYCAEHDIPVIYTVVDGASYFYRDGDALLLVLALLPAVVSAGTAPAVVSVDSVTVQVGQEFTVPVRITGVSNLYGYDVRLPHDTAILQGVRVDHGNFLNQPWFVVRNGFWTYNGTGCGGYCAWYALTSLNPALPVSGNGTLVYVTYRALQPGVTTLQPWVQLSTRDGIEIPATVRGGTVTVVAADKD